jgi:hypothetical protein
LADVPLVEVTRGLVRAWLSGLLSKPTQEPYKPVRPRLGAQMVRNVLNLLRCALEAVCEAGELEVRELLGHRSITTTERYAHFAFDALTRAADETDAVRRSPMLTR